jgi:hypothetical protein
MHVEFSSGASAIGNRSNSTNLILLIVLIILLLGVAAWCDSGVAL